MTPKKFFYVLCGLLAVLLLAGGASYYLATKTLRSGTLELAKSLADQESADHQLTLLSDLQNQYERLGTLLPVISQALPREKDQSTIALQLHNIANESGMDLSNITFSASTTPGPTSQTVKVGDVLAIPVTFQLTGTYDQLQTFLQHQEKLSRYTSVTSLGISRITDQQLSYNISLNAYLKP